MSFSEPLVTIGLPFYNPGYYLVESVKSIFAQEYKNWELIVIDDGSTDDSFNLISSIKDERIYIHRYKENKGLEYRLNQIAYLARGRYIARMDADDLMHPQRLIKQIDIMQKYPEIDLIFTDAIVIDGESTPIGKLKNFKLDLYNIFRWGVILHPSVLGKREWFLKNSYSYSYPRAEDRELWIRTFYKTKFYHLYEPLHFYRFFGRVRTKSFLESYKSERRILLKYGPKMIGFMKTIQLYARSHCKSIVLRLLDIIGKEQIITRNKLIYITSFEKNQFSSIVDKIRNINLQVS